MHNVFVTGLTASLLTGLATFVGALPILFTDRLGKQWLAGLLGFGGGVMLAAISFSLIVPGTDAAIAQGANKAIAALIMAVGMAIGGRLLSLAHQYFPHEHFFKGTDGRNVKNLARIWLFVTAITIHNFPEGLAVGVSLGSPNLNDGVATAIGIGLQNMPEGLAVAASLLTEKYSVRYALWISLLTGLVEPLGGLVGVSVAALATSILPWAMAFAAGAMLFVICDEIIPESHQRGNEREGTIGAMVGFITMMLLDISLST
jgi:zinc transporter, ZIP family